MIAYHPLLPEEHNFFIQSVLDFYEEDCEDFGENTMTKEKVVNTINRSISHPEEVSCWIFTFKNEKVGYGLLCSFWSNEYGGKVLIVDELYVVPAHRGMGIVSNFLNYLSTLPNYVMLDLEVFPHKQKAQKLYKRLGFEVTERVFMNKFIN